MSARARPARPGAQSRSLRWPGSPSPGSPAATSPKTWWIDSGWECGTMLLPCLAAATADILESRDGPAGVIEAYRGLVVIEPGQWRSPYDEIHGRSEVGRPAKYTPEFRRERVDLGRSSGCTRVELAGSLR